MIRLIVDSTCDLPKEYIKEHEIIVLPLRVLVNKEEYLDGETITVDEVYHEMRAGIIPMTSQPEPERIYKVFIDIAKKGQDFIYIAFSAALSGTYQFAQGILKEVKELYPDVNMNVINSKSGSTATGLLVMQAQKLIKEGKHEYHTIVNLVEELVNHIEHVFTISDLSWLIKGGRIGKTQGMIGNILNINPILHVNDGKMEVIQKVRGRKKAFHAVIDIVEERAGSLTNQIIGISHADDLEAAQEMARLIEERVGCKTFMINKIGSVLGSHLGIGGVGIFFFNQRAAELLIK